MTHMHATHRAMELLAAEALSIARKPLRQIYRETEHDDDERRYLFWACHLAVRFKEATGVTVAQDRARFDRWVAGYVNAPPAQGRLG